MEVRKRNLAVLKNRGYTLGHYFGYGKATLTSAFVILDLLAFASHGETRLRVLAWHEAAVASHGGRHTGFSGIRGQSLRIGCS